MKRGTRILGRPRRARPGPVCSARSFRLFIALLLALLTRADAAWRPADLPYREYIGGPVSGLAAADDSTVWAVAPYWYGRPDDNYVRWNSLAYRSLNDGRLWDLPWDAPGNDPTPNARPFQDVQLRAATFVDATTGWLFGRRRPLFGVGDPPGNFTFYHTTDGGRTWTESTLPVSPAGTAEAVDFAIDATDSTHAVAVAGRRVFETQDGVTWTERPGPWPDIHDVQARGLPMPRVAGEDGGRAVSGAITPLGFVEDATGGGAFHALAFPDAQTGFLAGGDTASAAVLRTTDGGASWQTVLSVPGTIFRAVAAPRTTHVWAAGARTDGGGVIYASRDGGETWTLEHTTPGAIHALAFRDVWHGFAAGDDGVLLYTPSEPAAGDLDANGQVDAEDAAGVLRRAAGLVESSAHDAMIAGGPPLTVVSAVETLLRGQLGASADPASRALVVYNAAAPDANANGMGDSEEIARYYAMRRGIPEVRLLPISWPDPDQFTGGGSPGAPRANWTACFNALVEPLRARLDALGRDNVDTIVLTYGMPYTFTVFSPDGSTELLTVDQAINDVYGVDAMNWSSAPAYAAPFTSINERYGKSRFGKGGRPDGQPVVSSAGEATAGPYYLTGRIDGPSVETCKAMVDNAVFAEEYFGPGGYEGTAYVDTRASVFNPEGGQPYDLAFLRAYQPLYDSYTGYDRSIARTILTFADRGLAWRDEVTYNPVGSPGARWRDGSTAGDAPRAMFYAGWYNYGSYNPVWEWLPGSVGIDFNSASAHGFRNGTYFAGGALNAGLTALVGVLTEPFNYHPKPDALMEYLARGATLAEAAMLATDTPRTARALVLGDPLYRPFAPHPARAVPAPALSTTDSRTAGGWTVTLESDIPVRAVLRYTVDGSEPGPESPRAAGMPPFYARYHTFHLPDTATLRYAVEATPP